MIWPGTSDPYKRKKIIKFLILSAKALEPGVYHVHTQLNVANVGPGLGPGQTVVVSGDPIIKPIPYGNIAYQSIIIGVGYVITFATRPWQVI